MRFTTLLVLILLFEFSFSFYLEVKPLAENALENGTVSHSAPVSDRDVWENRPIFNNIDSQINGNRGSGRWDFDYMRGIEKSETGNHDHRDEENSHFLRDARRDIGYYPLAMLKSWRSYRTNLLKKNNSPDLRNSDDSVPFWAARG